METQKARLKPKYVPFSYYFEREPKNDNKFPSNYYSIKIPNTDPFSLLHRTQRLFQKSSAQFEDKPCVPLNPLLKFGNS